MNGLPFPFLGKIPIFTQAISNTAQHTNSLLLDKSSYPNYSILSPVMKLHRAFSLLKDRMQEALDGLLKPAAYIMSADCGTGKGAAVKDFLRGWKSKGFPGGGSVLIFVATLAEIDAYKDGAGLDRADYAVATSDPGYTNHGAGLHAAERVPILFATHSKAYRLLAGLPSFADADAFHYKGKRRSLVIWDERCSPVEPASFSLWDLMALPKALKTLSGDADLLHSMILPLIRDAGAGAIGIPSEVRAIADRVLQNGKIGKDAQATIDALAKLAGSKAYRSGVDKEGGQFIGAGLPMPANMGPLFVLDASARLTNRYDDWSPYGFEVIHLEPATIAYEALKVHVCDRGCGRTVMRNQVQRLKIFIEVAALINSKPGQRFLIVIAKEFTGGKNDDLTQLPLDLKSLLDHPDDVKMENWGRHRGSNEYRHIENAIILGTWQYNENAYDAIGLAQQGRLNLSSLTATRQAVMNSETLENLYQAVCRIRIRNRVGAHCSSANAYLFMSDSLERRKLIRRAFPGCSIETWQPVVPKKPCKRDLVLAAVLNALAGTMEVSFKDITQACGGGGKSFLTDIAKDERFTDALQKNGIGIVPMGAGKGFRRIAKGEA